MKLQSKVNTLVMHTWEPEHYKAVVERYARKHKLVRRAGRKLVVKRYVPEKLFSARFLMINGDDFVGVQDCWKRAECDPAIVFSYRDPYEDDMTAFVESAVYFLYEEPNRGHQ